MYSDPRGLARRITGMLTAKRQAKYETAWLNPKVPGEHRTSSRVPRFPELDITLSGVWLAKGFLNSTCVRNIIAMQEAQLLTRTHPSWKGNPSCRLCNIAPETPQHIVSCCPQNRPTLMLDRHNAAARNIYYWLCKKYRLTPPHHSQPVPVSQESGGVTIWWDRYIDTPKKLLHYRPDMVLHLKERKVMYVIEFAVSWFTGIDTMIRRKFDKYAVNSCLPDSHEASLPPGDSLSGELQRIHGCTVFVIPIVIGCGGEITNESSKWLSSLPDITEREKLHLVERLQRSVVLGTDRLIRAHLGASGRT